jgi:tetratricopeptide (TPR) repeat protein
VDTDRNLLFGVLALQLDYIDRDGFVSACAAWATRKGTPLADLLVSLGLLTSDDRGEVERLMERRLKRHRGDVQSSLAEAADGAVRGALAAVGDEVLARSLPPPPAPWMGEPTLVPTNDDAPRYAMLRLAGVGGVGRVWLVRDGSLGREVALKELRPDRADPDSWNRFVREARVTGQLEHPGIVPVYEVGRRPQDNQPYYTMRFVHGRTLRDAIAAYHERRTRIEAGPLEVRELLGAFVQVCQAVGYAHSRGVLHRDLKPHNVALGDYGEVMVLDWGLAKVLSEPQREASRAAHDTPGRPLAPEADAEATQPGELLGTPAYMAPEQADGRLDLLDARTDVYGLGAILYHLLTGTPPFDGQDTPEVLERVLHGVPRRPRELVADTPPALEAVCLRALARRREERYPTALALAAEVQHWLADEPVTAYREPPAVRLARWGRQHRTAVTAAAALLLTATLALAVGLVVVNAERSQTAQARSLTQRALERVTLEQEKTTQALDRSQQAERSAGEQRQLALKTVRDVVGDIRAQLKDRPGQKELRKALLGRALAGLADVARAADTMTAIDHETVWVHFELGDIFREIEEGGSAEAKKQYQQAHDLARQVGEASPESAQAQRDLALSHRKLGDLSLELGDSQAALDSYSKALELSQRLADADPASAPAQRDLALSHRRIGDVSLRRGERQAALESYKKGLDLHQRLADADPRSAIAQRDLSVAHNKLGDVYLELKDRKAALDHCRNALELSQRLADDDPASSLAQRDLSVSHTKLGDVYLELGDNPAALDSYKSSHAILKRLAEADRGSALAQRDLSVSYDRLGDVFRRLQDQSAALSAYRKGLELRQRLADADKDNALAQRDLSVSHDELGDTYLGMADRRLALESYKKALELRRQLADADATSALAQRDLLSSFLKLGNLAQQSYEFKEAQDWYAQGLDVARRFAKPDLFKPQVAVLEDRLRFCRAAEEAVADPATALRQPDDLRGNVFVATIYALVRKEKQPAKARTAADMLAEIARGADDLYDAACGYALCVPLAENAEMKDRYAARAVDLLRQAVAKGYKNAAHMKTDTDLESLHQRDDFKKLIADLEAAIRPKD